MIKNNKIINKTIEKDFINENKEIAFGKIGNNTI